MAVSLQACFLPTLRRCTPAFLAQLFRIRQQRVMAILALKKLEAEAEGERWAEEAAELEAAEKAEAEKAAAAESEAAAGGIDSGDSAPVTAAEGGAAADTSASPPGDADAAAPAAKAAGEAAEAGGAAGEATAEPAVGAADGEQPRGREMAMEDFQNEEELEEFIKDMHPLDVLAEVWTRTLKLYLEQSATGRLPK